MAVSSYLFGAHADGQEVKAFRITDGVFSAEFIEYGAAIRSLTVPDRNGRHVNVVLGYGTLSEYETNSGFVGATIGRFGNRIGGACFELNGKTYRIAQNDGENTLHGGLAGFDKRLWHGEQKGENAVIFTRLSPDGEEGFPGNLTVTVTFTLSGGTLSIRYDADTDADTVVNLTNHSYFNLNGGGTAMEHRLMISAERFTENDETCLPTGRILPVADTPFDFRQSKPIGRDIGCKNVHLQRGKGYDHNFILTGAKDAAVLESDATGIRMTMHTDMPGVQFYSGNCLDPRKAEDGTVRSYRDAVCLETQLFPNAMHCYGFPSAVLHKGEHLSIKTVYAFTTF